jgi:hypothetical protein
MILAISLREEATTTVTATTMNRTPKAFLVSTGDFCTVMMQLHII